MESLASHYSGTISASSAGFGWPTIAFQQPQPQPQPLSIYYPNTNQRPWYKQEQETIAPAAATATHNIHDLHHPNTHDFFQPSTAAMNNFLSLQDFATASLDHSTGSNTIVYSGFAGGSGGGFVLPMSGHQGRGCFGEEQGKQSGVENYLGNSSYSSYQVGNQQLPVGDVKAAAGYEQSGGFSGWGLSVQATMASRPGNVASVCHGAPLFSVWNDS